MRCLFAVSSWFVQRASLTFYIDLSDVTNRYYAVLYRTIVVYEKKNRSVVFSGSRKIPTLGSTVQWETRQASFPTGTVGPRVGIFLSPLNTSDGFYLSHMLRTNGGKDKNLTAARRKTSDVIVTLKWRNAMSHHRYSVSYGSISLHYIRKNALFDDEQDKESIIRVRVGTLNSW